MANIAIIDDDPAMDILMENLRFRGHDIYRIRSASEGLSSIDKIASVDLVILDIIMPHSSVKEEPSLRMTSSTGMEIFREIRIRNEALPIITYSATQDTGIIDVLSDDPSAIFISKWDGCTLKEFVRKIHEMLGVNSVPSLPVSFIVHGHNDNIKLSLKNYLQNILKLTEPIILHEQPNQGKTIIEKFENYAATSTLIFVLLTPDDIAAAANDPEHSKRRARQNVIFEMGYFLGMLGRESGRIILLHQGPLELPSDISGVAYIDISGGIESAGEQIRREIQHVL